MLSLLSAKVKGSRDKCNLKLMNDCLKDKHSIFFDLFAFVSKKKKKIRRGK